MAVQSLEVTFGDVTVRCNTIDEAIRLARELGAQSQPSTIAAPPKIEPRRVPAASSAAAVIPLPLPVSRSWSIPDGLEEFCRRLTRQQFEVLRLIATAAGEVSIHRLRELMGLSHNREVSLLITSSKRIARDCGLEWSSIAQFRIQGTQHQRTSLYRAGPLLRGGVPTVGRD